MENTFSTLYQEYRCTNQLQAFEALKYIFNDVGDTNSWLGKIKLIQEGVFGLKASFEGCSPDSLIYSGQLFLKVIYAAYLIQEAIPISESELEWTHLVCPWNDRRAKRDQEQLSLFQILEYCPKHLTKEEILDPASVVRDFFSIGTLQEWTGRWNQLREYDFYQYSIMDGDEGEYLYDFECIYKLTEASYLIYARHAQHMAKLSIEVELPSQP
ncbi:hypothetical protein [Algoriphagus sp.]|uniref:hypothetical protein n=1 Tax=Algoriphagus sp. TaxID=1872435 RepID=UPI003F70FC4A